MKKAFFQSKISIAEFRQRRRQLLEALELSIASSRLRGQALRDHQARELGKLLHHAWEKVPFYRAYYEERGFHPADFNGLQDLERIPVLDKAVLRSQKLSELRPAAGTEQDVFLSTSGSTGVPVRMYKSQSALWRFQAAAMLAYEDWCEGQPYSNVLYILDPKPGNIDARLADLLRTLALEDRFLSSSMDSSLHHEALFHFCPEYISSYPSTMRNLAAEVLRRGKACDTVKLINLTSELLDQAARSLIERAFPEAKLVESYTSTEGGFMATACPDKGGYHVLEDQLLLELDKLAENGLGEVLVTDLCNWATPIIRYSGLGDYASLAKEECHCGNPHLRIASLEGRIADSIEVEQGRLVTPYALTNPVAGLAGVLKYQIHQVELRRFLVRIVPEPESGLSKEDVARELEAAFRQALQCDVSCDVSFEDDIVPAEGQRKVPLVLAMPKASEVTHV